MADDLRNRLLGTERAVRTGRVGRLLASGRAAAGIAAAAAGARLRGRELGAVEGDIGDVVRLVERLGDLKGVAMKAGQILAYVDPTLAEELRRSLSVLQTSSSASPFEDVARTVRDAFGVRAGELLDGLVREPIASASIGQVHRARIGARDMAVKVRHPGIVRALEADFAAATIAPLVGGVLGGASRENIESFVSEARTAMLEECDYALEAERQTRFGAWFAHHETLRVPSLVPEWCAPAVLTSEFRPGLPLDVIVNAEAPVRNRIGTALFELYIGTLYRHGWFHADPHPGNYAFSERGEVMVYDFGCVRSFDAATVRALAALARAIRRDDWASIVEALVALGAPPPSRSAAAATRSLLRGFFAPLLTPGRRAIEPGEGFRANTILRDKRALAGLRLPGKLLFLFRIRFGLYAVLARLGAVADWSALEEAWAHEVLSAGVAPEGGPDAAIGLEAP